MEIQLDAIKKYYKDRLILDIDNYRIKSGEITGIFGPNGAGKTTLLKIIAGLDNDFSGHMTYDGLELNKAVSVEITMVLQKPHLFRRSVYENVVYPLKIRSIDKNKREKKVEEILERFEISSLRNQNAKTLSGGESQKVSLARSLAFEPQLILLDEPTSNIDSQSLQTLEREILSYNHDTGASVVIVTHSIEQAKRLCTDIVYMDNGRVVK